MQVRRCGLRARDRSEDHFWWLVNLLEGFGCTFVQDTLRLKALVLVEIVCGHAGSEDRNVALAELSENSLSWGWLIFSWEANPKISQTQTLTRWLFHRRGWTSSWFHRTCGPYFPSASWLSSTFKLKMITINSAARQPYFASERLPILSPFSQFSTHTNHPG